MASAHRGPLLQEIERLFNQGCSTEAAEGQVLRQFIARGDEAAFEALMSRHGPMVLGVCRRILYNPADVEDAFQATFLVLVRRARSLQEAGSLGPWLHGVAYKVAARSRAASARRRVEEQKRSIGDPAAFDETPERNDLRRLLDDEIGRLPEKYRRPIILCYLEGLTQEEAARQLRWKAGVLRGRLDRARQRLRSRLIHRGLTPAAVLAATELIDSSASAAIPKALARAASELARQALTVPLAASAASSAPATLARQVLRSMVLSRAMTMALIVATGSMLLAARPFAWIPGDPKPEGARQTQPVVAASKTFAPGHPLDFRVVDRPTGKPLAGVALVVRVGDQEGLRATTDESGRVAIPMPAPAPKLMAVRARKDGYTPMTSWLQHPSAEEPLTESYTLAMSPLRPLRGTVRDEQGRPIAGVKVAPSIWSSSNEPFNRDEFDIDQNSATTDAEGRWTAEFMPSGIDFGHLAFGFSHPDFQSLQIGMGVEGGAETRKKYSSVVLTKGLDISGHVVDSRGQPIKDATVHGGPFSATTDAEGRFLVAHLGLGEIVLTVEARGFGPELKRIDLRPAIPPVEFRLGPGRTIQGRVADPRGKPIPGISVAASGWRGQRSLRWSTKTDEQGRFRWDDAPTDPVWINSYGDGYLRVSNREVPSTEKDSAITMSPIIRVTGTVVDSETGRPVESFTLVPGTGPTNGFATYWDRNQARRKTSGRYDIEFDQPDQGGRQLRIEADGYEPGISRLFRDAEGNLVIDFALHKGTRTEGTVHLKDGTPMAGADVIMVMPSQPAFITNGRPPTGRDQRFAKTDVEGRFAFPSELPPFTIVVLHESGFAERTAAQLAADPKLILASWGRVEGTFRRGGQPLAGQRLQLNGTRRGDTPKSIPYFSGEATSGADGRFTFERVIPGEVTVSEVVQLTPNMYSNSRSVRLEAKADETTRVDLGGTGRPVIGRLRVPPELAERVDLSGGLNWMRLKQSKVAAALDFFNLGKAYPILMRDYAIKVEADGSFRIDDVDAGTYDVSFRINELPSNPNERPRGFSDSLLGTAHREVVVPEMPDGRSDTPLDIGEIALEPVPAAKRVVLHVADPAPMIEFETLDGKRVRLADYRGKFVLLDFWATWCGPCLEETPHLKLTFEAFGKDNRFAMIGLSLDRSKEAPRLYADEQGLSWLQGFLGEWSTTRIPDQYGVRGIPSVWLIGPDGTILAKDLRGEQIKATVAEALGQK